MPDESDPFDPVLSAVAASPAATLLPQGVIGNRFALVRSLGVGGFGLVYEARDLRDGRRVALKVLRNATPDWLHRFKREFRALQGIVHPNLVTLDELFFLEGRWFFTMELLDGVDLVTHVRGTGWSAVFDSTVRQDIPATSDRRSTDGDAAELAPAAGFDEGKLRDGLRQLLEGLAVLHAADKVHRDVKPSNVLVTRDGRVVVLDFGLVVESLADDAFTKSGVIGTPAYMAPEQAASAHVGPAADLYSVGVVLYELLTGTLPFQGAPLKVIMEKQTRNAPPPASLVEGVPADLDALCTKLLRFDPSLRPSAADALRLLAAPRTHASVVPRTSSEASTFVGRSLELGELRSSFERVTKGELATVLVIGESGIGKSATVRRFTDQLADEHPDAMVLAGRCYEREAVPYKTLDGIVDLLSRRLSRMPAGEVAAVLPSRSAVLAQVFPTLLRIPSVAKEHAKLATTADPHELRRRAFLALREMFTRLALRHPTVVAIDDLQWADDDGLRALGELLAPPDAPPVLFIGTLRATPGETRALERLRSAVPDDMRVIALAALAPDEARELAVALLRRAGTLSADPAKIASEAGGHPMFVEELARNVALGQAERDDVKLDDAIWSRVERLEPATRAMAEVVAVAGKPLPQEILAAAARVELGEFHRRAALLRVANLVRTGGARADAVEPYHDRVREAVLAALAPARRQALHEALAIAFEAAAQLDPETMATHWREAGNAAHAAKYAHAAGDQASRAFAFDRAAQWYEQALGLLPDAQPGRRELSIKLGDALAKAGRGAEAVPHFEAAAAESPPIEALTLRRRAAEELLWSGHVDRGLEASRGVLAAVGVRMPRTAFGIVLALAYYSVRLTLRGVRFRERDRGLTTAEELARIDTCWAVGYPLIMVNSFLGHVFVIRSLLLALSVGDRERVARSVGIAATLHAARGNKGLRRTHALLDYTRELADRCGTAEAHYFWRASAGLSVYLQGRFKEAAQQLGDALEASRDTSVGLRWEQSSTRFLLVVVLARLGRFRSLRRIQQEGLHDAIARADLGASVNLRLAWASMAWLADDRPDIAETQAHAALREWPTEGFHVQHFSGFLARMLIALYVGKADEAYALSAECLRQTKRSWLWFTQTARVDVFNFVGVCGLAMLERNLGVREKLLREIQWCARRIDREGESTARGFSAVLRAGISLHGGNREGAVRGLDSASAMFEEADMKAYAAAARDRAARLRGEADSPEIARCAEVFRAEGVIAPERMISMLVPGFGMSAATS
jgi:serine/threonine protein kinase/tetratricopeptide (TPR) repeat protein